MHDLAAEITKAINASPDLNRRQKRRCRILMRHPLLCELVCHQVEEELLASGDITDLNRWDPEAWDWDAVLDRLMVLVDFIFKLILALIQVL